MKTLLLAVPVAAVLLALPTAALAQDPPPADAALEPPAPDAAPDEATADDAAAGDASDGRAGDPLPIAQAERPLVLPHMMLSPGFGMTFYHFDFGGPFSDTAVIMGVDAKLGLGDIAEIEVSPFTSQLAPNFAYGATIGGTVRLVDTEMLELGPRLRALFTTDGLGISPGLPVRIHATEMVRLDTGVYFGILTNNFPSGDTTFGLTGIGTTPLTLTPGIPLDVTVNPIPEFFVGLGTGFGIFDFANAGDTIFVPLALNAGGTIAVDDHPLVDIGAGFGFPYFIGTLPGADTVITQIWQVNVGARANIDLAEMMAQ